MPRTSAEIQADKLEEYLTVRLERLKRARKAFGTNDEPHREWLETFTGTGVGLDICCGDMPIKGAFGVDLGITIASWGCLPNTKGDDLRVVPNDECDYIVSNYIETFADANMALREWYRVTKPGGVLALVVRNADHEHYEQFAKGPLDNSNRRMCYNEKTIKYMVQSVGYKVDYIEVHGTAMRVKATKPWKS